MSREYSWHVFAINVIVVVILCNHSQVSNHHIFLQISLSVQSTNGIVPNNWEAKLISRNLIPSTKKQTSSWKPAADSPVSYFQIFQISVMFCLFGLQLCNLLVLPILTYFF